MDDIKKESLIEALGESGHRESALLLKNWNEMDDNANGVLEDLIKAKGYAKGKAHAEHAQNVKFDKVTTNSTDPEWQKENRKNKYDMEVSGEKADAEKGKAIRNQTAADKKIKAKKEANAPSNSFEHAVSRLKDKYSSN